MEIKINREYKDRMFIDLFGHNKENALSLYNAINGTSYDNPEDLEFTTIQDAIYMNMKNDVSFIIGTQISVYEHQSTVNPNMPYRGLKYISALLSKYADSKGVNEYGPSLIVFPTPQYIVFYNGEADFPEEETLYFSSACENPEQSCIEVKTRVLNINYGHNRAIMEACRSLGGYAQFVAKVREFYTGTGRMDMRDAIIRAVDVCIAEGILAEYLRNNKGAVIEMMLSEYDEVQTAKLWREAGKQEVRAQVQAEEAEKSREKISGILQALHASGMSIEEIKERLKISDEELESYGITE